MKRNKSVSISSYIVARINQLTEDRDKAKEEYDKMWYNKVIQEFKWLQQILNGKEK